VAALVLPYWWLAVAIVILRSTRGTAGSGIWYTFLIERLVERSYHPRDYVWRPLKAESLLDMAIVRCFPDGEGLILDWDVNSTRVASVSASHCLSPCSGPFRSHGHYRHGRDPAVKHWDTRNVVGKPVRLQTT